MGLTLSELVRRVGEDDVIVENLFESITKIHCGRRRTESTVTFLTRMLKPDHLLGDTAPPYLPLVIYLPYEKALAVRRAWREEHS